MKTGRPDHSADAGKADTQAVSYRNQKKRFPWWVKSTDQPTVEVDYTKIELPSIKKSTALWARHVHREDYEPFIRKSPDAGLKYHIGEERMISDWRKRWNNQKKYIQNHKPGSTQRDLALLYAAFSLYYDNYVDFEELTKQTGFVNITQRTGSDPWRGTPREASNMIEKAARALGASQVGFTLTDPYYLRGNIDYPPEMKYVIMILTEWAPEGTKRADSGLGTMANRTQTVREQMAAWGLRNFIKALGYRYHRLDGPWPAYGVKAGLGELGRMNRLVSPIYGAAVNLYPIVTDLPLAVDKPIDFGLQEFCKGCKRCAEECPVNALSMERDPTWEIRGEWNTPGKKVYFEKCISCAEYQFVTGTSCSICLGVCPWTKQDITSLHTVSKVIGAKIPKLARFLVMMDKIFGYGTTKDPKKLEKWWELDLPVFGIDSRRASG